MVGRLRLGGEWTSASKRLASVLKRVSCLFGELMACEASLGQGMSRE